MRSPSLFCTALLLLLIGAAAPAAGQYSGFNGGIRLGAAFTDLDSEPAAAAGSTLGFDSAYSLAVDLGYELRQGLELELVLSTAKHGISTAGGQFPGLDGGELWIAPVTLTLRYTFFLRQPLHPFFGGGVGWTWAHSYDGSQEFAALGISTIDLNADPGWVLHAGLEYDETERWYWILDLRYLELDGELEILSDSGAVYATPAYDGSQLLLNLGIGMRF